MLEAADGNRLAAFEALPDRPARAGILVLPDVRGLFSYYEELALRFAEAGLAALAIDYYGRTAGPSRRDADFDFAPHVPRSTWAGLQADVRAAAAHLRTTRAVHRPALDRLLLRRSPLPAAREPVRTSRWTGVIGFYGWPVGPFRNDMPAPADLVADFGSRVLALFGGADAGIAAKDVDAFQQALERGRGAPPRRHLPGCATFLLRPQAGGARGRLRAGLGRGARLPGAPWPSAA